MFENHTRAVDARPDLWVKRLTLVVGSRSYWQFFLKIFGPFLYVQDNQRLMGIMLRYVCWGTH